MYNYYELGIIAFILVGIGIVLWKGGAANPVGTGRLQHDMKNVRQEVSAIGTRMDTLDGTVTAEKRRIDGLDTRMASIEKQVDSVHTVTKALSESVRALTTEFREHREYVGGQLSVLGSMDERIASNARDVQTTMKCVEAIDARQDRMAEQVASTAVQCGATGRQVDRLYDHIVNKGMSK